MAARGGGKGGKGTASQKKAGRAGMGRAANPPRNQGRANPRLAAAVKGTRTSAQDRESIAASGMRNG